MLKLTCTAAVAALVVMTARGQAASQDPFEKPITIIVSSAVGGSVDALSRQLAPHWQKTLGRPINVENHEGAGGIIGVRYFMKQPADCHTVLVGTEAHFTAAVEKTGEISPEDVELINLQQFDPTTFTVLQTSRFKTIEDLLKEAKEKPNSITWGSPPTGSAALLAKILVRNWKLDLRFVPQGNGAETDTALLGGHIDVKVGTAAGDIAEVTGARVLAIASPERLHFLPDVPTFNEVAAKMGFEKLPNLGTARFVLVPKGCKAKFPERFQKLVKSFDEAFHSAEYQKALKDSGQALATSFYPPDESTARFRALARDSVKYRKELKS